MSGIKDKLECVNKIFIWVTIVIVSFLLALVLLFVGVGLRKFFLSTRQTLSPLECGFSTVKESRGYVSFRFFIFALVFTIFDVELVIVMPYICDNSERISHSVVFFTILNLLILGLLLE